MGRLPLLGPLSRRLSPSQFLLSPLPALLPLLLPSTGTSLHVIIGPQTVVLRAKVRISNWTIRQLLR